jgi:hypothetical protein
VLRYGRAALPEVGRQRPGIRGSGAQPIKDRTPSGVGNGAEHIL